MRMTPYVLSEYGIFDKATTDNTLAVLDWTIKDHGMYASIITYYGAQFYANAEVQKRGASSRRDSYIWTYTRS